MWATGSSVSWSFRYSTGSKFTQLSRMRMIRLLPLKRMRMSTHWSFRSFRNPCSTMLLTISSTHREMSMLLRSLSPWALQNSAAWMEASSASSLDRTVISKVSSSFTPKSRGSRAKVSAFRAGL